MTKSFHCEILAVDPERSQRFFSSIFGWRFEQIPGEEFWFAKTGSISGMGVYGAIMKRHDPDQPLLKNIVVKDIDATMKQIEQEGGKIVMPKTSIGGVGWLSFFCDPDGNSFGIWQEEQHNEFELTK